MNIIFINVPPLICSFFTYQIISSFLVIRQPKYKKAALFISCFLLNGMIIYIGDWANMPPTFLLFIAALFWCCEGSKWKKITLALTFSSAPFSLNCLIDSFLDMPHLGHLSIIYQIGKIAFWFLLWYVVKRFKFPNNFDLPVKYWYVLSLIACTPLLILFSIVLLPEDSEYIYPSMTRTIICILFIVILSILGILYAIYALYKASILEENKLLSEANDQYYKHLDSQIQQIRKLRHDMTNHLQVLSNLPEEEVKDYVQQLLVDKAIRNPIVYTRDSVLNAILSSKADFMEQNQIDFESSPNLCVNSSSSYISPSMLPLSSGDLIEWSLVCHSTLSYQKFCD